MKKLKIPITNCISQLIDDKSHHAEKILCNQLKTNGFSIYVELSTGFISKCHNLAFARFENYCEIHKFFSVAKSCPPKENIKYFSINFWKRVLEKLTWYLY